MARGVPTTNEQKDAFAAEYLRCGVVSVAARKVELPVRTAQDLAEALNADPVFAERRQAHRARILEAVTDSVMSLVELGTARAHDHAPIETEMGYSDVGAPYLKAVADLGRTAEKLARLASERKGELQTGPAIIVNLTDATAEEGPSGSPDGKS